MSNMLNQIKNPRENLRKNITLIKFLLPSSFGVLFFNFIFLNLALATINPQINYQGKLYDSSNVVVADGPQDFVFKLYNTSSGGTPIYTEIWDSGTRFVSSVNASMTAGETSVTSNTSISNLAIGDVIYNNTALDEVIVEAISGNIITISPTSKAWLIGDSITNKVSTRSGLFSANIGSVLSLSSVNFNQSNLYLGITINNINSTTNPEMKPRKRLTSVPYALNAEKINGATASSSPTAGQIPILDSTGALNVGIGAVNNSGHALNVVGTAALSTGTLWTNTSDRGVKKDILSIGGALDVLSKLKPSQFGYTNEYLTTHPELKDQTYYGFIAQEFAEVFPESVSKDGSTGYLQMNATNVIPYLVAGIKELHEKSVAIISSSETISGSEIILSDDDDVFVEDEGVIGYIKEKILAGTKVVKNFAVERVVAFTGIFENVKSKKVESQKIETKELCVGVVCISEEQLKNILASQPGSASYQVIKLSNDHYQISNSTIIAEAGAMLDQVINAAIEKGFAGIIFQPGKFN